MIEAAKVDGAKGWTLFWHILLPLLKPATIIVVVVTIIESLRAFDMVNIMTQGGPFNTSNVLVNFMYMEAFKTIVWGMARPLQWSCSSLCSDLSCSICVKLSNPKQIYHKIGGFYIMAQTAIIPKGGSAGEVQHPVVKPLLFILMLSFVIVWLLPVFGGILTSIRSMDDLTRNGFWAIPESFSLEYFKQAWTIGMLGRYLYNSFVITIPALIGTLFLSSLAAFALAGYRFKGNFIIYVTFVGGMLLPFQLLMLPIFQLSNFLKVYDTYWGLILIHTAFQLGFCTFFSGISC